MPRGGSFPSCQKAGQRGWGQLGTRGHRGCNCINAVYMLYAIGLSYDNRRKGYLFMSQYWGWTRDIKLPKWYQGRFGCFDLRNNMRSFWGYVARYVMIRFRSLTSFFLLHFLLIVVLSENHLALPFLINYFGYIKLPNSIFHQTFWIYVHYMNLDAYFDYLIPLILLSLS